MQKDSTLTALSLRIFLNQATDFIKKLVEAARVEPANIF